MSDVVATTKVSVTTNANNTADSFDRIVMSMGSKKGKTDSTHLAMSRFMASRDKVSKIKRDSNAKKMKLMIEDVWNKGTVTDVAQLIERQKRNFELRIKPPDQFIAKGLSLLETVRVGNVLEQTAAKENMLQVGRRDIVWEMPDNLQNSTEGLKKLTFLSGAADLQKVIDKVSGSKFVSSSSMNVASNISDKIVFQSVPERKDGASDPRGIKLGHSTSFRYLSHEDDNSLANRANANNQSAESVRSDKQSLESNDLSSVEEGSKVLATRSNVVGKDLWRDITEISTYTNMKYMQIGDEGAKLLSAALKNDYVIRKLCLAHAHINDLGAISIAKAIPFIHALKYLDLSSNAICDEGAVYLAKAIEEQYFHRAQEAKSKNDSELLIAKNHAELKAAALKCSVRRLSLAGNRIGMKGVLAIINTVLKSHKSFSNSKAHRTTRGIDWCSIRNNKLHNVDKESIVKLLEESNFVLENNISHWKNSYFREDGQHRYVLYRHHNRRGALHRNMVISTERDRDRISRVFLSPKTRKNNQLEEELSKEDSAEQYQSVPSNLASRDFNSDVSLDKGSDLNQDSFLSASSISELRNSVVERKTSTTNHARTRGEDDLLQDVESMTESSSDRMSSSHSESSEDGPQEEIDTSLYRSQLNRRIRKILCVIII